MEKELEGVMEKVYRGKLKDYKAKKVNRKYCFDLDIDRDLTSFLKIKYGFQHPQIPFDQKGQTFDFIIG